MPPYFSICIPNYNYGRYIGQTIQSVLDQSFEDFEIVVVDNASTDHSVDVVRGIGDSRIRLFQNRYNVGFAPNLQRATQHAEGRFVLLLSSDDLMLEGALARYHEVLEQRGESAENTIVCSSTDVIDGHGTLLRILYKPRGDPIVASMSPRDALRTNWEGVEITRGHDVLRECLLRGSAAVFCATMYPRRLWESVEGYDTTAVIAPDAAFMHKLLAAGADYLWIHERMFAYRVHESNQGSRAARDGGLKVQVDVYMRTLSYPQDVLDRVGVSRDEVIVAFIKRLCLEKGVSELSHGNWTQAFKMLAFCFATFPGHAVRIGRTYAVALLIGLGPFGIAIAAAARRIHRSVTRNV